jgi:Flp pilus assembly CpaE family ATPase
MVRAAIIAPDSDIRYRLEELLTQFSGLQITRRWEKHPNRHDLARFLRATATQLLIVSIEELDSALKLIESASSIQPGLQFIAVDRDCEVGTLQRLARLGVREFVSLPATIQSFQECLVPLVELIEKQPSRPSVGSLFSFLPAKGGSGASTAALNVSGAIPRDGDRVLLADFDLNNGVLDLMLNLKHEHSLRDALQKMEDIDQIWPDLVSTVGKLDILPIDEPNQHARYDLDLFRQLLEFVRSIYSVVCVDLAGSMDELESDVLNNSNRILLVSAIDVPSLHLARQKLKQLERMDLADRVEVVLNEVSNPYRMTVTEAQTFLGRSDKKISFSLPADARAIHDAIRDGKLVSTECALGSKYRQLADSLLSRPFRERETSALKSWFKRSPATSPSQSEELVRV